VEENAADVIVVGGGPAGSVTAAQLANEGYEVLLLERATFPREKACGEYLNPGVCRLLRELGLFDAVLAAGPALLEGMRVESASAGFTVRYRESAGPALGIRRSVFDAVLLSRAKEAGVKVREGVQVFGAVTESERVVGVSVRGEGGKQETLRAGFTVGADGHSSVIARSLGSKLTNIGPTRLGLVSHYRTDALTSYGKMLVGNKTYCGVAPVGRDEVSVALVVPEKLKRSGQSTSEFFAEQLTLIPTLSQTLGEAERTARIYGVSPLARRSNPVAGRGYLLVGDSAGYVDPLTGEGVFRALRGADLAAASIQVALHRRDRFPIEYGGLRERELGKKERVTSVVQLFLRHRKGFNYALRRLDASPKSSQLFSDVLGDYRPAADALHPRYLLSLLAPPIPKRSV
jgi:geranylgeranyl reductase family protein